MVRFSDRVPRDLRPNRLSAARAEHGVIPFDLTQSNPTRCGLPYDSRLLEGLADPAALSYHPQPRGPLCARQAVAALYADLEVAVDPAHVVLTASTSEAYSLLFRLLADAGDAVLVPTPSYPLFEQLARLDAIDAVGYSLDPEDLWRIDTSTLEPTDDRAKAVVVVHPNNPTGTFVHPDDGVWLCRRCRDHGWALIADEVFLPYQLGDRPRPPATFAASNDCLSFTLGGLSKAAGLPQLKLAWIVVSGPGSLVAQALERLDHVADAYLSVSTPVAVAAPRLLAGQHILQEAIRSRCRRNLEALEEAVEKVPAVSLHRPEGGWSAVLRIPTVVDEEELLLQALSEHGVAAQPGYFFDFPTPGYLVLSLLPPEPVFAEGVRRLLAAIVATL